jgi:hypothetical protein
MNQFFDERNGMPAGRLGITPNAEVAKSSAKPIRGLDTFQRHQ